MVIKPIVLAPFNKRIGLPITVPGLFERKAEGEAHAFMHECILALSTLALERAAETALCNTAPAALNVEGGYLGRTAAPMLLHAAVGPTQPARESNPEAYWSSG